MRTGKRVRWGPVGGARVPTTYLLVFRTGHRAEHRTKMLEDTPDVLVVESDIDRADLYAAWLRQECTVRVAHDAQAAIAAVDEVDAVVLGPGRPDRARRVLHAIHEHRVPTVTVVGEDGRPDPGPVPDERVEDPRSPATLRDAVAGLLARQTYSRNVGELFAAAAERAAIESGTEEGADERRRELETRVDELRERVDESLDELVESAGFAAAYRAVTEAEGNN